MPKTFIEMFLTFEKQHSANRCAKRAQKWCFHEHRPRAPRAPVYAAKCAQGSTHVYVRVLWVPRYLPSLTLFRVHAGPRSGFDPLTGPCLQNECRLAVTFQGTVSRGLRCKACFEAHRKLPGEGQRGGNGQPRLCCTARQWLDPDYLN